MDYVRALFCCRDIRTYISWLFLLFIPKIERGSSGNAGGGGGGGGGLEGTSGLRSMLRKVYRQEGWRGLFRGAGARVLFHTPSTAITMAVFEDCKRRWSEVLHHHWQRWRGKPGVFSYSYLYLLLQLLPLHLTHNTHCVWGRSPRELLLSPLRSTSDSNIFIAQGTPSAIKVHLIREKSLWEQSFPVRSRVSSALLTMHGWSRWEQFFKRH